MNIETIDLKLVYNSLSKILSRESFILTDLIRKVESIEKGHELSKVLGTLAISADGTLFINREFCEKHIPNEEALTVLFLHELFHQILFDTSMLTKIDQKDAEAYIKKLAMNIAMDSRINAMLGHLYDENLNAKKVFKDLYESFNTKGKEEEIIHLPLFFREGNDEEISSKISPFAGSLYNEFHTEKKFNSFYDMYKEILDFLRKNKEKYDQQTTTIVLVGDHSEDGIGSGKIKELSSEDIDRIRDAITENLRNEEIKKESGRGFKGLDKDSGEIASKTGNPIITIIQTIEGYEHKSIDTNILKKINVKSLAHNILISSRVKVGKWVTSPIMPKIISKIDIIKLADDIPISLWRHKRFVNRLDPKLIPIYFDVSGSMTSYIPKILDLIINIDARIEHIWCFSTYVKQHSIQQLEERKIEGDGGTSFDSVIKHSVENNFRSIMVITDGHDDVRMNDKHPNIDHVTTILVPHSNRSNWFSKHYENTHNLDEVIKD